MSIPLICPTCETAFSVPSDGDWNCPNCWTLWRVEVVLTKVRERNAVEKLASGTCRLKVEGDSVDCPTHFGIGTVGRQQWCRVCSARENLLRAAEARR